MRLSDFAAVQSLVQARAHLVAQRDHGGIDITICGELQRPDFVDVIVPAVRLELGHRIREIDGLLTNLGVDISS